MRTGPGTVIRTAWRSSWRIGICGLAFAGGLIASRLLLQLFGLDLARMPAQAPEETAGYYLLAGSIALAVGTVWVAQGVGSTWKKRWVVVSAFLIVGFGLSTTIETAIYGTVDRPSLLVLLFLFPCLLLATLEAALFAPGQDGRWDRPASEFFRSRVWPDWAWRLAAGVVLFPVVYFVFGILVSPIVTEHYAQGVAGLSLPSPGVIVRTQLLRSILHILVAIPVMVLWRGSRLQLVAALSLAFFVFVAAYDVILANEIPLVLVLTHGLEVLADSAVYSWVLVALLVPPRMWGEQARPAG